MRSKEIVHYICDSGKLWMISTWQSLFLLTHQVIENVLKSIFLKNGRDSIFFFAKSRGLFQSKHSFLQYLFCPYVFPETLWPSVFRYKCKSAFDWYIKSTHSSHSICLWVQPECSFYLMLSCFSTSRISIKEFNENKIINLGFLKEGHALDKKGKVAVGTMEILHFSPPNKSSANIF